MKEHVGPNEIKAFKVGDVLECIIENNKLDGIIGHRYKVESICPSDHAYRDIKTECGKSIPAYRLSYPEESIVTYDCTDTKVIKTEMRMGRVTGSIYFDDPIPSRLCGEILIPEENKKSKKIELKTFNVNRI